MPSKLSTNHSSHPLLITALWVTLTGVLFTPIFFSTSLSIAWSIGIALTVSTFVSFLIHQMNSSSKNKKTQQPIYVNIKDFKPSLMIEFTVYSPASNNFCYDKEEDDWCYFGNYQSAVIPDSNGHVPHPVKIENVKGDGIIRSGHCSFHLSPEGVLKAFGKNIFGLAGIGVNSHTTIHPTRVEFDLPIIMVDVGDRHVIALDQKGSVYTWGLGNNLGYKLGKDKEHQTTPKCVTIDGLNNYLHNEKPDVVTRVYNGYVLTKKGRLFSPNNNSKYIERDNSLIREINSVTVGFNSAMAFVQTNSDVTKVFQWEKSSYSWKPEPVSFPSWVKTRMVKQIYAGAFDHYFLTTEGYLYKRPEDFNDSTKWTLLTSGIKSIESESLLIDKDGYYVKRDHKSCGFFEYNYLAPPRENTETFLKGPKALPTDFQKSQASMVLCSNPDITSAGSEDEAEKDLTNHGAFDYT